MRQLPISRGISGFDVWGIPRWERVCNEREGSGFEVSGLNGYVFRLKDLLTPITREEKKREA